jgi:hypothetical protein
MRWVQWLHAPTSEALSLLRQQARRVGGQMLGVEPERLRIAYQTPSGRPVLMLDNLPSALSLSLSNVDKDTVVAIDDCDVIGVDLVRLHDGPGLRYWFDQEEDHPGPMQAASQWAAREAAYKAMAIDRPFVPDEFSIEAAQDLTFLWRFTAPGHHFQGTGAYSIHGHLLCAVASRQAFDKGKVM